MPEEKVKKTFPENITSAVVSLPDTFANVVLSMLGGAHRKGNKRLVKSILSRDLRFMFPEAFLPKKKP